MTEIKCLDLARKIYEEAKIDREFIIMPNKLFFSVCVDIAEQNDYNVMPFNVADCMFDSFYLENELKVYLVACDEELAKYYRDLADSYFNNKE